MKKIISIVLTSVLLFVMISIQAVADVPISVVSINPTVEPSWGADYWQVTINLDAQIASIPLGNVQMSSDETLKAALRNNIKINDVLLGDILTNKGDYSVMVEYNGSSINMFSSKGQNVFRPTSQQKIEILSGLCDETKTKTFNPITYYQSASNVWSTTPFPTTAVSMKINVVSINPAVEPSWGADYWQVTINLDTQIASQPLGNVQMSSDETLKAALRNNIKINDVLLGDILTDKDDYSVMVEYNGNSINMFSSKGQNVFSANSQQKIEILSGLCDETKTKTFNPITYYQSASNVWSTTPFPTAAVSMKINVVSINPTVEPSWSADYWQVTINLDVQIASQPLGNVQMSSDETLKAALRNNIKINDVLLGDILTDKDDYSVMVEYNGNSINMFSSKGQNVFSATSQQKIEILSGLCDETKTKTFNPITYYQSASNVWSTTPPTNVVSDIPSTGDDFNILAVSLSVLSLIGFVAVIPKKKKSVYNSKI